MAIWPHLGEAPRRWLAGVFVSVNLATVLYMNRMPWMIEASGRWLEEDAPPALASRVRRGERWLRQYGYATGLDSRWAMFGEQSRFNWNYRIVALMADGTDALLPLPGQADRSFLQRHFVDFREAKFELNIYPRAYLQQAYARHLCHAYPAVAGTAVVAVRIAVDYHGLHDPAAARQARTVVASPTYSAVREQVPCER